MSMEKKRLPVISAGLDKRRKLADDSYNASLIVSFEYKRKYYHLTGGGGSKIKLKPKDLRSRETKELFLRAVEKATGIVRSMPVFTFDRFEARYFSDQFDEGSDLVKALRRYANNLPDTRLKTKIGYHTVANVVDEFSNGKRVEMHEITPEWLESLEKYLTTPYMKQTKSRSVLRAGRNATTVGFYLRNVRTVVFDWVKNEKPQGYEIPFGLAKDGLYQIPSGQNVKKALDFEDVARLYHFELPEGSQLSFYRDLWIFSYLANGMNMKDVCRLKYRNIDMERITFSRSKTVGTRKANQQEIVIPLTTEIGRILDKWKVSGSISDFVFPILRPGMTARQELNKVQWTIKKVNDTMREVASQLGIQKNVNTYAARHSFATIAMRNGFSVAMISRSLGHASTAITENYLGSFEIQQMKDLAEKISDFSKYKPKE